MSNKQRVIKFVRHPAFTAAQLSARNPYLEVGEVVFELNNANLASKFKVGPGVWNELLYFEDELFTSTSISNPIGDAKNNIAGKSAIQILDLMLNPYQIPVISNVLNNAGGGFGNIKTLEIGQSVSGAINVSYVVSNPTNLQGSTPIIVSAGGIFNNEGTFANSGTIILNLANALNPSSIINYNIQLSGIHAKGSITPVITSFNWAPKIIWGTTAVLNPSASDINALTQKQTITSVNYKRDYVFNTSGYCVVAIPFMLNPTSMIFTDVTDPNAPAGFSMEDLGNITINNGVGTYTYKILRSSFLITASISKLRIA